MTDEPKRDDMNKALFTSLVLSLSTTAMQQLGKLVNPLTGKTETDLDAAQITIDMISMLKEKAKGNLDASEERLLTNSLASLQMNYVETAAPRAAGDFAPAAPPAQSPQPQETAQADKNQPPNPSPGPEEGEKQRDSEDKRRYHKSYG